MLKKNFKSLFLCMLGGLVIGTIVPPINVPGIEPGLMYLVSSFLLGIAFGCLFAQIDEKVLSKIFRSRILFLLLSIASGALFPTTLIERRLLTLMTLGLLISGIVGYLIEDFIEKIGKSRKGYYSFDNHEDEVYDDDYDDCYYYDDDYDDCYDDDDDYDDCYDDYDDYDDCYDDYELY